jgi:hypothetical protein
MFLIFFLYWSSERDLKTVCFEIAKIVSLQPVEEKSRQVF